MIVPGYFEDLGVLHEHTLPPRAYYVPASAPATSNPWEREESDRFHPLNGRWAFRYLPSIHDLTEPFWETSAAVPEGFATIPVPSTWQHLGYDQHQYTNVRYPIPFDPPHVPQDNPCGAYLRDFDHTPD
ncbi:sugar-binding domain-containing protein, partial [[Pseudopropionibacterium] massiliense]|uniref:sugar-binding domain-containing protein n=1 Tax=[Pseudopropionibacterium] massiliense TaxID=2220000 RepID=UPI00319E8C5A